VVCAEVLDFRTILSLLGGRGGHHTSWIDQDDRALGFTTGPSGNRLDRIHKDFCRIARRSHWPADPAARASVLDDPTAPERALKNRSGKPRRFKALVTFLSDLATHALRCPPPTPSRDGTRNAHWSGILTGFPRLGINVDHTKATRQRGHWRQTLRWRVRLVSSVRHSSGNRDEPTILGFRCGFTISGLHSLRRTGNTLPGEFLRQAGAFACSGVALQDKFASVDLLTCLVLR
jgi:hypothetical protein